MRRKALLLVCVAVLVLASCSSSGDDDAEQNGDGGPGTTAVETTETTETPETTEPSDDDPPTDAEDPAAFVRDSVDATLAANSFQIESELALTLDAMAFALTVDGPVDYRSLVADVVIGITSGSDDGSMSIRADGDTMWVAADGSGVPAMPGGSTWIEGDASRLDTADSFGSEGLLATIYALRAAEDVTSDGEEEIDGVSTTRYSSSFTYGEAVEAAGPDSAAFAEAFSLRGFDHAVIDIEVWIGDDGVIRRLTYDLEESEPGSLTGSYDLSLTAVDEEVDAPEAPDPSEVTSGPEAEAWLDANLI